MSVTLFLNSIQSQETKKLYDWCLRQYGYDRLKLGDPKQIEKDIIDFIIKQKEEGKSHSAISNYLNALKAYYHINDVVLNTRKIAKFMPPKRRIRKDRAYTHEEISKLLEVSELRMRVVILLFASSGVRLGVIPLLKIRNLDNNNKLTVYENDNEEHFTFITPECKNAIDSYLDMRLRYGEKLNDNSPLIREEFNLRNQTAIRKARHITKQLLVFKLDLLAKNVGVRTREVALVHGFRKFFTTQLVNSRINAEIREMLLGHKIGLASCYYRPTEQEMYSEYEKAIDNLTINEENRLRKKVETLTVEKSRLDRIEEKMMRLEGIYKK